jgi:hypothetical protein
VKRLGRLAKSIKLVGSGVRSSCNSRLMVFLPLLSGLIANDIIKSWKSNYM